MYAVHFQLGNADEGEAVVIHTAPGVELTPELLARAGKEAGRLLEWQRVGVAWEAERRPQLEQELRDAWHGSVTDVYLATLAKAYAEVSELPGLHVIQTLADMLGRSPNTIKMHMVRARDRGYLAGEARKAHGELTDRAREVLGEDWHVVSVDEEQ